MDTFKAGDPDTPVTGIATTFLATYDVLQRAAASGKNLIVTHEPTFYEHQERTERLGDDPVLAAKRALIEKHKLVVWRFHDHWHKRQPDGIKQGMDEKMGLTPFRIDTATTWGKDIPWEWPLYRLPETTVGQLAATMKEKLKANIVRVVGNPDMKVTRVGFACGAPGSWTQIRMLQSENVEVLLAGESPEWETTEYVRDAVAAGKRKAIVFLGHCNSEEGGMEYLRPLAEGHRSRSFGRVHPCWRPLLVAAVGTRIGQRARGFTPALHASRGATGTLGRGTRSSAELARSSWWHSSTDS